VNRMILRLTGLSDGEKGERKGKSALDFSVQDASAALPQNCQTTKWILDFASLCVNITLVTISGKLRAAQGQGRKALCLLGKTNGKLLVGLLVRLRMGQVEAEIGMIVGASNVHRHDLALFLLLEERIHCFQQKGFHPAAGL
jgi:hypothetical protein